jgi:hypothetical protein
VTGPLRRGLGEQRQLHPRMPFAKPPAATRAPGGNAVAAQGGVAGVSQLTAPYPAPPQSESRQDFGRFSQAGLNLEVDFCSAAGAATQIRCFDWRG